MTEPTFALAIPHATWIPERVLLMRELREALGISKDVRGFAGTNRPPPSAYMEFTDREHWLAWFTKILRWAVETDASHLLVLQDDVVVAPHFWESLRAMVKAWPDDFVSLAATHSLGPEVARQGRRSYLTSKVVGWGYVLPTTMVVELIAWCEAGNLAKFRERLPNDGEDTMIGVFLRELGILARCPVPTVIDHLFCKSTNEGFDDHTHRRSTVTWRAFSPEDMVCRDWWQTTAAVLPDDDWRRCWYCGDRPEQMRSEKTGAGICKLCLATLTLRAMGVGVQKDAAK